ncbi:DUF4286 family protein [Blastococcus saxobsidens]|uniref:DUF4286 family protein n=1 Tax=Blastococcus saxobsidens TaxID=138336 RepID=UPI0006867BDD|nr:DUF4286 family protein [Blastococcus saxobsidens]
MQWDEGDRGLLGQGVLAIWCDMAPESDDQFNAWYTHEHLPERVGVPGFLRGRRYIRDDRHGVDGQRYLAFYEATDTAVFSSPAYLERLNNPTPLTRTMAPRLENAKRTVLSVQASYGRGVGRELTIVEFGPTDAGAVSEWVSSSLVPQALSRPQLTGLHLLVPDEAATKAKEGTQEARGVTRAMAQWVLVMEGTGGVPDVAAELVLGADGLASHGASGTPTSITYEYTVSLLSPDLHTGPGAAAAS